MTPRKGEHGEPWLIHEDDLMMANICSGVEGDLGTFYSSDDSNRAIACVNALDGRDPEEVERILEACDAYTFWHTGPQAHCDDPQCDCMDAGHEATEALKSIAKEVGSRQAYLDRSSRAIARAMGREMGAGDE